MPRKPFLKFSGYTLYVQQKADFYVSLPIMYSHSREWTYELMAALLNASDDAFQFADLSGKLLYTNKAAVENIGVNLKDGENIYVWEFEEIFDGPEDWKAHLEDIREGRIKRLRGRHRNQHTGKVTNVEVSARIVSVSGEEYVIAAERNIEERLEEENKLRSTTEILERTSKLATVGGWRHDLNTQEVSWTDQVYDIYNVDPGARVYRVACTSMDFARYGTGIKSSCAKMS